MPPPQVRVRDRQVREFCEKRKTFVGNEKECICEACHGGGGGAAAGGALKRKAECIDLT